MKKAMIAGKKIFFFGKIHKLSQSHAISIQLYESRTEADLKILNQNCE